MARTRYLKPGFFANEQLAELSAWHRLLFAGLWTIADRSGRLEDRPKRIKALVFPYDELTADQVDVMLADLASGGDPFIARYEVDGVRCIQVLKWAAHQSPHKNETESLLPSPRTSKKIEQSTTLHPNLEPSTTMDRPDSVPNGEWGMGNGEWGTGDGERGTPAVASAPPPRSSASGGPHTLIDGRAMRRHGQHRRCYEARGLCITPWVWEELCGRIGGDPATAASRLAAWADAEVASIGQQPIGDAPDAWWRKRFAAWQGVEALPASTKGARTVAAGNRLQAALDAGAELDPFGTKAFERQRRELAEKASA